MIIAWVLCMIVTVTSLVSQLGHSAALQIRLLTIEEEAHTAFVAVEKQLDYCEAQLSNTAPLAVLTEHDAATTCDITLVDANTTGELIRVRALRNAVPKNPIRSDSKHTKQTQLESMVYRDKRDHSIRRLNWRVVWLATGSTRPVLP